MTLDRLWAGWRSEYISALGQEAEGGDGAGGAPGDCVFCAILASGEPDRATMVVARGRRVLAILNAYPYTCGHLMVMPVRHVAELEDLDAEEGAELWSTVTTAVRAVKEAYRPEGLNLGANLGRAAGAGVPGHFHVHVVPRWAGDTNFMTSVAEARVLPEALGTTWERVRKAWPAAG